MIRNIIFDVGMVLVDWQPRDAFRQLGFDEETVKAVAAATIESEAWSENDRSLLSDEEIAAEFVRRAPEYEREIRLFWDNVGLPVRQFDYTKDWIRELKGRGYGVYILSNYGRRTYSQTKDEALSFLSEVDGALFSFQVQQVKPEPEIYQTLLERYSLVPGECVFFDDRPENIEAAGRAGIHGVVFENQKQAKEELERLCEEQG